MQSGARARGYYQRYPHDVEEDELERLYLPEEEDFTREALLAAPESLLLWDAPRVSDVLRGSVAAS